MTPQQLALVRELGELFPHLDGFQFRSSGTESVEAAIRYGKACHPSGLVVAALAGAYHGLTLAAQQTCAHLLAIPQHGCPFIPTSGSRRG